MFDASGLGHAVAPAMKHPTSVLLLDGCPSQGLGSTLFGILRAATPRRFELHKETIGNAQLLHSGEYGLRELVHRWQPAMLFWVVSPEGTGRMLPHLSGIQDAFSRPIVVVSEAGEPGEVFEVLKHGAHDFITPPLKECEILPRVWQILEEGKWSGGEMPDQPDSGGSGL